MPRLARLARAPRACVPPGHPARRQRRAVLVAAALLALGLSPLVGAPTARAATGLQIVAATRYEALPSQRVVRVSIDAVATALTPDQGNQRTVYSGMTFAAQRGIANVAATAAGNPLAASVTATTADYTEIGITFDRKVAYQERYAFQVTFDLPDPGGAPDRDVRVSHSLVAFPVWAFGSAATPGSSVTVTFPAGYTASVDFGTMTQTTGAGGTTVLTASAIPDPVTFIAYVSAEQPGAFVDTPLAVKVGSMQAKIDVRRWDDDAAWGTRMLDLMAGGLPALQQLIGLDYKVHGTLTVEEAASARLGEYAGVYSDLTQLITVRYDADGYTGLHEAAHIWFNERLFRDRWIGEAFAEYYAVQAGRQIGASGRISQLTDALRAHRIALNDWGAIGAESSAVEQYAYAATYELANLIARRTDAAGLRRVWQAADVAEMAYQPIHGGAPEQGVAFTQQGWQRFLDLLEQRTGATYADLWREWVTNSTQAALLDQRATARVDYAAAVKAAGAWELPRQIRYAMSSWTFAEAETSLTQARAVLKDRDLLVAEAAALRLTLPARLRSLFETGATLAPATTEAKAELATLGTLQTASAQLSRPIDSLEWVGLLGAEPQRALDAARTAFQRGDLAATTSSARAASAERAAAARVGEARVVLAGGTLLAIDGLVLVAFSARRLRRRAPSAARLPDVSGQSVAPLG